MVASQEARSTDSPRRDQRRGPTTSESGARGGLAAIDSRDRPANVDAERAVLGSILLKADVCDDVALIVRVDDFSDEGHQLLYRHLLELHDSGKRIDVTIVLERLRTKGDLDRFGGPAALAEIIEAVPHAAHASHNAHVFALDRHAPATGSAGAGLRLRFRHSGHRRGDDGRGPCRRCRYRY